MSDTNKNHDDTDQDTAYFRSLADGRRRVETRRAAAFEVRKSPADTADVAAVDANVPTASANPAHAAAAPVGGGGQPVPVQSIDEPVILDKTVGPGDNALVTSGTEPAPTLGQIPSTTAPEVASAAAYRTNIATVADPRTEVIRLPDTQLTGMASATESVTCPECGLAALIDTAKRQSNDFCRACDFPLFWARSNIVAPTGVETGASLRRLPGTVGRAATAGVPCPVCAEPNSLSARICVRCGSNMYPVDLPPPVEYVPPPLPEPEPEPVDRSWIWIVVLCAAILAIAIITAWVVLS